MSSLLNIFTGNQYTIGDLMNIDAGRQERAGSCQVKLLKTYHELKKESVLDKFRSFFTRSPSPRAWRPDFPGAAREAP